MAKPHLAAATAADLTDHFDPTPNAIAKDLYAIGEIPPLGHVPRQMHAYTIRRDREGEPESAMRDEIVATPEIDPDQVLVMVMATTRNVMAVTRCFRPVNGSGDMRHPMAPSPNSPPFKDNN